MNIWGKVRTLWQKDDFAEIRASFNDYFADFEVKLPEKIMTKDQIEENGWSINYVILADEQDNKLCLDFFASHRMTDPIHARIREDGTFSSLATYSTTVGYDPQIKGDYERQKQALDEHNQRVTEILSKKGLI